MQCNAVQPTPYRHYMNLTPHILTQCHGNGTIDCVYRNLYPKCDALGSPIGYNIATLGFATLMVCSWHKSNLETSPKGLIPSVYNR